MFRDPIPWAFVITIVAYLALLVARTPTDEDDG